MSAPATSTTHEVFNQPTPYGGYNFFERDVALRQALARESAGWAAPRLSAFAQELGDADMLRHGYLANRHAPELQTHDNFGHRINEIHLHPSWHELMRWPKLSCVCSSGAWRLAR